MFANKLTDLYRRREILADDEDPEETPNQGREVAKHLNFKRLSLYDNLI